MDDILIIVLVVLAVISAAAIIIAILARRKKTPPPEEEYDSAYFTSQLVEMLDTISRATLERDCAEFTEMLYEQARFCEPSDKAELAPLEREILESICRIHPDDSDQVITEKCAEISKLMEQRQSLLYEENDTQYT